MVTLIALNLAWTFAALPAAPSQADAKSREAIEILVTCPSLTDLWLVQNPNFQDELNTLLGKIEVAIRKLSPYSNATLRSALKDTGRR